MSKNKLLLFIFSIVVFISVLWFFLQKPSSTLREDQTNFKVENTDDITRIFIADHTGATILLDKRENIWYLNDSARARVDAIETILTTLGNLVIKAPVSRKSVPHRLKRIAANHKKIEIYINGEKNPSKTIFLSDPSKDHFGNLALLETKKHGRSEIPYFIKEKGKKGYLTPIFFTNILEWMYTAVFEYAPEDIQQIRIEHMDKPEESFQMTLEGGKVKMVQSLLTRQKIESFDQFLANDFVKGFESIFYEIDDEDLTVFEQDSVIKSPVFKKISVVDVYGNENQITFYQKAEKIREDQLDKVQLVYDRDRLYGYYNGRLVLCQYFVFNKLFYHLSDFSR